MAEEAAADGQSPAPFSWLEPHPLFCIILAGEDEVAFGIQKDFLIAQSTYFQKYFAEKKEEKIEDVVRFPEIDPVVFGLAQLFMFTGTISIAPGPGYDLLIAVWKLGNELGIKGLCDEALRAMTEHRAETNSIPAIDLLVNVWKSTPEGSPIRTLLLSWMAEYIQSSESRAEFTKSLPQEVLSELVVTMSHFNTPPAIQVKSASSPIGQHKNVHYIDHEGEERAAKTTKHRQSDTLPNRVKKTGPRVSLPPAPKPKIKRAVGEGGQFSADHKLNFCADLLSRMMSGPGFWTRLVGPFKEPVKPVEDGVPDYFEKVKRPMDLGTIKKKMDAGEYGSAEEFEADVKQIFENCYAYWGRTHEMSAAAERFQKSFEEKYAEMFKWMSKNTDTTDAT
ncbi:putative Bromodomain testis-specific protein [Xylariaceae sp. FL0594]|nr:putative Bromodomain testis-specific protein [Xylariaceae sp. FL0594]